MSKNDDLFHFSTKEARRLFLLWVNEREWVRLRREGGKPPPWTKDPVLASVRFCNVRRSDDRVTRWMKENWVQPLVGEEDAWARIVVGRLINEPHTLSELTLEDCLNPVLVTDTLTELLGEEPRRRVFNPAYMVVPHGEKIAKPFFIGRIVESLNHAIYGGMIGDWRTCQEAFDAMTTIQHIGSFTAAQVIADMKLVPRAMLAKANDAHCWAAPGPGSLRGLTRWHGTKIGPSQFDDALHEMISWLRPRLIELHPRLGGMDAQDYQSVCCECDKYLRVLAGGRARQGFDAMECTCQTAQNAQ